MKKHLLKTILLLVSLYCGSLLFAQQTIEVNQATILSDYEKVNKGDTLLLNLSEVESYKAVVKRISKSYDGILGITAQLVDTDFGYCFISVSDKGVSMSIEIPEQDKLYSLSTHKGKQQLTQSSLSEMQKDRVELSEPLIPPARYDIDTDKVSFVSQEDIEEPVTIKVMVVYTLAAKYWAEYSPTITDIDEVIDLAMQRSNLVMDNSGTHVTFELVYKHETSYYEANNYDDLYYITFTRENASDFGFNDDLAIMDEVHRLRERYEADFVVLLADINFVGGLAWVFNSDQPDLGIPQLSFSLNRVQQAANTYTVVHEMGHNLGCSHHKNQEGIGRYFYSYGWGGITDEGTRFSTVMTYETGSHFPDGYRYPNIPYFSSPDIIFEGVPIGVEDEADNTLSIKQTKHISSGYAELLDTRLKSLSIGDETLVPAFEKHISKYAVHVPLETDHIGEIIAIPNNDNAYILGITGDYNLAVGSNVFEVFVVSEYSYNMPKTYTITVYREAVNSDATLASLTVSEGTLLPEFNPNATHYEVTVEDDVAEIDITGVANHAEASVSGNVEGLALNAGTSTVRITVTAADGIAQKEYVIFIEKKMSKDATLSSLTISAGELVPEFDPETTWYTVDVPYEVTEVDIIGTTNHPNATITTPNLTGRQLKVGTTAIVLTVMAEDGTTQKHYRIEFIRAPSNDATLAGLRVMEDDTELELDPEFDPEVFYYQTEVLSYTSSEFATIEATSNNPDAIVSGTGIKELLLNKENLFDIIVLAQDGVTTNTYTVEIIRAGCIAIESIAKESFQLYPNPVKDMLYIKGESSTHPHIKVFNLQGVLLKQANDNKIDMSDLANGVYVIEVEGTKAKIIK